MQGLRTAEAAFRRLRELRHQPAVAIAYTNYPMYGMRGWTPRVRYRVEVLCRDYDKYVCVRLDGRLFSVKVGYLYLDPWEFDRLVGNRYVWHLVPYEPAFNRIDQWHC